MSTFKKATVLCLILSMLSVTACSTGATDSSGAESSAAESSTAYDSTSTSKESSGQESLPENSEDASSEKASSEDAISEGNTVSEYLTTFIEGKTSAECLTYEGTKGVWAHLVNPFNQVSLFSPTTADDFTADTESITICFNVSGVTSEINAFCGLSAYGIGDEDEELQVWNNDTYKQLTGEDFEFIIDKDGYYEMTVPVAKLAAGLDFWEGLNYVYIIEPCFIGAQKTDAEGSYLDELTDGLSFEFLGIRAN